MTTTEKTRYIATPWDIQYWGRNTRTYYHVKEDILRNVVQKKWTKKLSTCRMQSNLPILLKCTVFYSFAKRTKIKVPFDIMPSLLRAYINPKFSSLQMRKMVAIYCVLKYLNRGSSSFTHTFNSSLAQKSMNIFEAQIDPFFTFIVFNFLVQMLQHANILISDFFCQDSWKLT